VKTDKELGTPARKARSGFSISAWHKPFLFVLAWGFLAVGIVGVFLPVLPGTLFLIMAAACFTRSSPRFEAWLLAHPRFGPSVRAWRATGSVPRRAKVFAALSLAVSWLILLATGATAVVTVTCFAVFLAIAVYVASRPEE
jgi:uncharacterized membrane protein YbaN (DUF454 family)